MPRLFIFGLFLLVVLTVIWLIDLVLLRYMNRPWWQNKVVRRVFRVLLPLGYISVILLGAGEYLGSTTTALVGSLGTSLISVIILSLVPALLVSGLFHLANVYLDRREQKKTQSTPEALREPIDSSRRVFLRRAAIVVPALTLSTGVVGTMRSFTGVNVFRKRLSFPNLPADLEGLRVLHLSDLHLRHYVTTDDLEQVLIDAESHSPDLVVVTGDIADDLDQLPTALNMISQLGAPLGTYASLGNHEYFRGVGRVRRIHEASPVPLLVDTGHVVRVGQTDLLVAGIDDPRRMGAKETAFYRRTIDTTLTRSDSHDFSILMSHRPDALDYASTQGLDLILAGHTHGGQLGLFNRSVFETYWPERYLWGHYRRGTTQLYTSSGVGHWFPFRLGCPAEAPVIELTRG